MSPVARLLAAALLGVTVLAVLAGSPLTAGPAAARSYAEPRADLASPGVVRDRSESGDDPVVKVRVDRVPRDLGEGAAPSEGHMMAQRAGLTYDQWRTGRLVLGVIGLAVMAVFAFRAVRGRRARRRTSGGE